jgi:hypothetical protein
MDAGLCWNGKLIRDPVFQDDKKGIKDESELLELLSHHFADTNEQIPVACGK